MCVSVWFWETEKCCSSEDSFSDVSNKEERAETSSSRKGHFPHTKPGFERFCDYVALHHKELLSFFRRAKRKLQPRKWVGTKSSVRWMASHFIEFFASLILLLRCTSLLLNWIDSRSPLFLSVASVVVSPPHVQAEVWQYFCWAAVRRKKIWFLLLFKELHCISPGGLIFH